MSTVFDERANGMRTCFRIRRLERGSRSCEVATFDLEILVNGRTVAQIFDAKLVEGEDYRFVIGPSFVGSDGEWFSTVNLGRHLQDSLVWRLQRELEGNPFDFHPTTPNREEG